MLIVVTKKAGKSKIMFPLPGERDFFARYGAELRQRGPLAEARRIDRMKATPLTPLERQALRKISRFPDRVYPTHSPLMRRLERRQLISRRQLIGATRSQDSRFKYDLDDRAYYALGLWGSPYTDWEGAAPAAHCRCGHSYTEHRGQSRPSSPACRTKDCRCRSWEWQAKPRRKHARPRSPKKGSGKR